MHALLCAVGFESVLVDELSRAGATAERVRDGVVALESRDWLDPAFARQILPDATRHAADSIGGLAKAVVYVLVPALEADPRPFRLQVFAPDPSEDAAILDRRAELLSTRIREELSEKRRRVLRRLDDGAMTHAQVLLIGREEVLVSVAEARRLPSGMFWPSPFPAGRAPIADDWDAPSSAFRKLREALAWLDRPIHEGEHVLDLGASPGGWSHVALAAGAHVTAVDKAELDPRVLAHPRLVHLARDAFKYELDAGAPPVDWLLSDIIAAPERAVELLARWAEGPRFRGLVYHLKFKGDEGYGRIDEARALLTAAGLGRVRAKKLVFDKHEVTLMLAPEAGVRAAWGE